jgi:hypothetical protein
MAAGVFASGGSGEAAQTVAVIHETIPAPVAALANSTESSLDLSPKEETGILDIEDKVPQVEELPVPAETAKMKLDVTLEPARETPFEKDDEQPIVLPPYLVPPPTLPAGGKVQMVTVVLRGSGDKTRDALRMRRIHGTVMSFPGEDRFAFLVYEHGRGYMVEFPNFTTGVCPDLIARLQFLVGSENVRVEQITFQ